jgi:predicted N-acetyltransferase YhbS
MRVEVDHQQLPGGLRLRSARPGELAQIADLLIDRGEEADALDHRLVVEDADAGWESCAVVVDGDRVVSTATLLDEQVRLGSVVLPAGQVELVATSRDYEGRGLVRALMAWAHERCTRRGQVVQVMVGIPYFYRLFGYHYAIDIPTPRAVSPPGTLGEARLQRASPADASELLALQHSTQSGADVAMPHSPARVRWLLGHESSHTWVLRREHAVVASARVPEGDRESGLLSAEVAASDPAAARDLLAGLVALAHGDAPRVVERPGTVTDAVWAPWTQTDTGHDAAQYYVRIPDQAVLLDLVRPVLAERLRTAGLDTGKEVLISTFRRHFRMAMSADGLGEVITGGPMQAPGSLGGVGVAPDALAALLFGQHGIAGLARRRPDVYPGPNRDLYEVLFPAQRADLLTYYLPY